MDVEDEGDHHEYRGCDEGVSALEDHYEGSAMSDLLASYEA